MPASENLHMNRRQPTPSSGPVASHSSVVGKTRQGCARRHRHELRDNCVTIRMPASCLGGRAIGTRTSKASAAQAPAVTKLLAAQDIPMIEKSDVRVRKRTEAPTLVSHILVRQARGGYPRQHLTMVEVASEGPGRKSAYG